MIIYGLLISSMKINNLCFNIGLLYLGLASET